MKFLRLLVLLLKRLRLTLLKCFDLGRVALAVRVQCRLASSLVLFFPQVYDAISATSSRSAELVLKGSVPHPPSANRN
jgi:hypothetical protein